jgi:hypothetical protein
MYKFIENTAEQLSKAMAGLKQTGTHSHEITQAVLMGMYTLGYRDANLERNLTQNSKSDLKEYINNLKGCKGWFDEDK